MYRWLSTWLTARLRRRAERGAVAVLLAVVLGSGVVIGSAALVVDVGQLTLELQQLRSSADAAAMAVGEECAKNPATCAGDALSIARDYASRNHPGANVTVPSPLFVYDNSGNITMATANVCGYIFGQPLANQFNPTNPSTVCANTSAYTGNPTCVGSPPAGVSYVNVWVSYDIGSGSGASRYILPPTFAGAVVKGYTGKQMIACARAMWGGAGAGVTKAITMSRCEYNSITGNGTNLHGEPDQDPTTPSYEKVFLPHSRAKSLYGGCAGSLSGWDFILATHDGLTKGSSCHNDTDVADTNYEDGINFSDGVGRCDGGLSASIDGPIVLQVSVYDTVKPGTDPSCPANIVAYGTTYPCYRTVGIAGFVLTAYRFSGGSDQLSSSYPTSTNSTICANNGNQCIFGYFTSVSRTDPSVPIQASSYGANAVELAG
jgi:Flp pilus assembly protein TadG